LWWREWARAREREGGEREREWGGRERGGRERDSGEGEGEREERDSGEGEGEREMEREIVGRERERRRER
jgi:hypothetical protein